MDTKKIIIAVIVILIVVVGAFLYISANSHETKLEITSNSSMKNGDNITVVLKDQYRNVYPGQMVDIKLLDDSGWADKFNATTDDDGEISVKLEGFENGNYTVHANFNGTMFLSSSKSVSNLEINDGY